MTSTPMCFIYLTADHNFVHVHSMLARLLHVCKLSSLSSLSQVHCLLTGHMLMVALVLCRLIPVGEEDWLRENKDGVRELQQALQLEVEVRIKIHKVSFCSAKQCLACGLKVS